jgi:hypothetical protein
MALAIDAGQKHHDYRSAGVVTRSAFKGTPDEPSGDPSPSRRSLVRARVEAAQTLTTHGPVASEWSLAGMSG